MAYEQPEHTIYCSDVNYAFDFIKTRINGIQGYLGHLMT